MHIRGTVIQGTGIAGKLFGTPTANLVIDNAPEGLEAGVYAGRVSINDTVYRAAIYFVDPREKFEVYVLDFSGDLLGHTLDVELGQRVSSHVAWESEEQMREKITDDIRCVRESV